MKTSALAALVLACLPVLAEEANPFREKAVVKEAEAAIVFRYRAEGMDQRIDSSHVMVLDNGGIPDHVLGVEVMSAEKGKDFAKGFAELIGAKDAASGPMRSSGGELFDVGIRFRKGEATVDIMVSDSALAEVETSGKARVVKRVLPITEDIAARIRKKAAEAFPADPDEAARTALGAFACRILKEADLGETHLVARVADGSRSSVGGYRIRESGEVQGLTLAQALRPLLFDGALYTKADEFSAPAVAFRILKDGEGVDVLVSFETSLIQIRSSDPKAPEAKVVVAPLGGARSAFVRLAKVAFPEDPVIRELKD